MASQEVFDMAKQLAVEVFPKFWAGNDEAEPLDPESEENIRSAAQEMFEKAFGMALKNAPCRDVRCEISFQAQVLYPALDLFMRELKRLWADKMKESTAKLATQKSPAGMGEG